MVLVTFSNIILKINILHNILNITYHYLKAILYNSDKISHALE